MNLAQYSHFWLGRLLGRSLPTFVQQPELCQFGLSLERPGPAHRTTHHRFIVFAASFPKPAQPRTAGAARRLHSPPPASGLPGEARYYHSVRFGSPRRIQMLSRFSRAGLQALNRARPGSWCTSRASLGPPRNERAVPFAAPLLCSCVSPPNATGFPMCACVLFTRCSPDAARDSHGL
jgi:hypothetical protein